MGTMYEDAKDCLVEKVTPMKLDAKCDEFYDKTKEMTMQLKLFKKNYSSPAGMSAVGKELDNVNKALDKLRTAIITAK